MNKTMGLQTTNLNPKILVENPWNVNYVNSSNQEKIEQSLKRFGFFRPILTRELEDGTLQILGGAHRVKAAIDLGLDTIPTINLGKVDEVTAKEISLADNGRYGVDDTVKLNELLNSLPTLGEISEFLPYSEVDLDVLTASSNIDLDNLIEKAPEPELSDLGEEKSEPSNKSAYRVLKFKVPIEDATMVEDFINNIKMSKGFTSSDSQTNAGDALIYICREATIS